MTDGRSLMPKFEDFSKYTMPKDRRQGVATNGVFFWHDFPLEPDRLTLSDNWPEYIDNLNEKSAKIWPRFADFLRASDEKMLILSNSQENLTQFATDDADFEKNFGLGPDAFRKINQTLVDFGARNFKLKFLTRHLSDMELCCQQISAPHFECQFVGAISRPFENTIASSLAYDQYCDIGRVCGSFDGGQKLVKQASDRSALIYRNGSRGAALWGCLVAMPDGYLVCFNGQSKVFKLVLDDNDLYFSNRTKWIRDGGVSAGQS
jgi:hypothetical protein